MNLNKCISLYLLSNMRILLFFVFKFAFFTHFRDKWWVASSIPTQKFKNMSEKTYISESTLGLGVFAKVPIQRGENIFYLNGRLIDFEASIREKGEYSVQVGIRSYVDPISPGRYLNHSCDPNSGFINDIALVALTDILPHDEIRFDYSTTMLERHWELDCACGAINCRRRIRDFDLIPSSLQKQYLSMGIVQGFIMQALLTTTGAEKAAA